MKFVNLEMKEYDLFVQMNFSHFTQSIEHFSYRDKTQKDCHIVGVKDDFNNVIAACLLTEAQSLKVFKYYYSHRGPVMDFTDIKLVSFFFENLTQYLKKRKCLFVLVDPYVIENIRNHSGEILKSNDNSSLFHTLNELGYKHDGYSVGYSDKSQIRWISVLDLKDKTLDEILNNMEYKTRRNIKKTEEMGVQIRDLDISETGLFYSLFKMAEEKHGFSFRGQDYFERLQKTYKNHSSIKLAYIDLEEYIEKLYAEQEKLCIEMKDIEQTLALNANSKKNKIRKQENDKKISSLKGRIEEAKQLKERNGKVLNLTAALYIYNNHEVYYLSSGSNQNFNRFMGAYKLQWEMIKFAKDNNIDRYNFYGITGDFTENAEDVGVIKFKSGFNGHVEELVGDFIKPVRPVFYKIYKLLNK
ncbi:aminoacyltransferase [Mammaliicoccus fleurettii]|uniref:aminoacyltransferase n=1 Tax=Mammaliicoccus fleurettii TaxID=150056 RepID=UPI002DB89AE5|nr:aminoacyltransferase [Mammaliicoccus fleurettii]MEB7724236.1 aminoacyltransferase [Mammaliicoccus fleurettii]